MVFTQNIDGLEREVGVSDGKIVAVHGSWGSQRCVKCKIAFADEKMKEAVQSGEVPYCEVEGCGAVVKPDIVMFGEALNVEFEDLERKVGEGDMMIIMGTSLSVHPCSRLPTLVGKGVHRVLLNREKVGDMGSRQDDVCILDGCDEGVKKLADELGWREELETLWKQVVAEKETAIEGLPEDEESMDDRIEKYASKIEQSRTISDGHKRMLEEHLGNKFEDILNLPHAKAEA